MSNFVSKVTYFENTGVANTDETLKLAKERADELGVRNIVVASKTGRTGLKAAEIFRGYNLVVVTQVIGFVEPNVHKLTAENRAVLEKNGAKVVTAAHAFGTLGRAINRKFNTIQVDEIIANVLRLFGAGVKVACEVTCMATDAGLVRANEDAIGIGGTSDGADTAILVKATNTHTFFDIRIREIICKPRM